MAAAAQPHYKYSDGKAVDVTPSYAVVKDQLAFIEGWLGLTTTDAESGEVTALTISPEEYQFKVPSSLSVSKGEVIRIDTADLTGHTPDDTAYNKNAESSTNRSFFRATSDKDSNHVVTGILLVGR